MRVHTAALNANRRPCMSARSRIDVGNVTPMAFAVLKLTANSKFETCSTPPCQCEVKHLSRAI